MSLDDRAELYAEQAEALLQVLHPVGVLRYEAAVPPPDIQATMTKLWQMLRALPKDANRLRFTIEVEVQARYTDWKRLALKTPYFQSCLDSAINRVESYAQDPDDEKAAKRKLGWFADVDLEHGDWRVLSAEQVSKSDPSQADLA
mmetsp:Transcript_88430/g.236261  ORF Transcript_88430/g.236261 Transcript_88430/m.236261 type:complete len:145 (+) Transcript_88430:396-830(+)